jgi:hypothetical protein
MSEVYFQQKPIAEWNTARGVWEVPGMANLFCEHLELFSETWLTSGTMRNGQVFALPMQEHPTTDSASLSSPTLPTPAARDGKDGQAEHQRDGVVQTDTVARAIFNSGEVLLPTTRTSMAHGATAKEIEAGNPKSRIETEVMLLPTPNTMEHLPARTGEARERILHRGDINGSRRSSVGNLREDILEVPTSWGKFEPAIRRWEQVLGRPAPAPTKPDGKDDAHRLSSKFTEWMMGLPDGWITDAGLTRNEELKACGNGVVPQQAELALRLLLGESNITVASVESKLFATPNTRDTLPAREGEAYERVRNAGGRKNRLSSGNLREQVVHLLPQPERERERETLFPTPTVSDTYTDNLRSTQQKTGSMHSVTLPQAVRMVAAGKETNV